MVDKDPNSADFAVLIPIRSFFDGKTRIRSVGSNLKAELVKEAAAGVVDAARSYPTFVVTSENNVKGWAQNQKCDVIDGGAANLNEDLGSACSALAARDYRRVAIALGDVPLLRADDIAESLAAQGAYLITDVKRRGTNLLAIDLPIPITLSFGPNSRALHCEQVIELGIALRVIEESFACFDLDTPGDILALKELRATKSEQLRPQELDKLEQLFRAAERLSGT